MFVSLKVRLKMCRVFTFIRDLGILIFWKLYLTKFPFNTIKLCDQTIIYWVVFHPMQSICHCRWNVLSKIYFANTFFTFENIKSTRPIKIVDSNISRNELFYLQLKHFVSLIKKKRITSQILDSGYDSLKICLAIKKSIIQRDINKIKVV